RARCRLSKKGEENANMREPHYPALYQINTRVWLTELSRTSGRPVTLDDIPDAERDRLAELGFDWIWFLSVWQTGSAAQHVPVPWCSACGPCKPPVLPPNGAW